MVPGLNEYMKDLHSDAKDAFFLWLCSGKPRHGPVNEHMRITRLNFKYALRQCKINEESA